MIKTEKIISEGVIYTNLVAPNINKKLWSCVKDGSNTHSEYHIKNISLFGIISNPIKLKNTSNPVTAKNNIYKALSEYYTLPDYDRNTKHNLSMNNQISIVRKRTQTKCERCNHTIQPKQPYAIIHSIPLTLCLNCTHKHQLM